MINLTKLKNNLKLVLIVIVIVSCNGHKPLLRADLDLALRLSGENRPELIKVLEHYSLNPKDSLKLESAKFLISNMIQHYSYGGEYMDKHIKDVDSVHRDYPSPIKSILYRVPARVSAVNGELKTEFDLLNITSDFLVNNIERSFELWENMPEISKISFEDFCEYILPYRIGNEPLISWKDSSMVNYFGFEDVKDYELDIASYSKYCNYAIPSYILTKTVKLTDTLLHKYIPDCIDAAYRTVQINRSLGIPSAIDFIPHHSIADDRHYWYINVDGRSLEKNNSSYKSSYAAKVYRKTYSINPTPEDRENFVPHFMRDPYNRDVTEIYEKVIDVEYDFGDVPSNVEYGYISVFNSLSWNEVTWSRLKRGKATFKKMGREIIYMPTYYDGYNQVYGKYPILVDDKGEVKEILPNKGLTQNVELKRKFTFSIYGEHHGSALIGCTLIASNEGIYSKFDSISTISSYKNMEYDTLETSSNEKYKYWGIISSRRSSFAEIQFFNAKGEQIKGVTFIIDKDSTYKENNIGIVKNIFDNDLLTSWSIQNIAGVKFDKAEEISYIRYISANDGNGIYPGEDYELLYFDRGKWVSFDRKVASDYVINFNGVPTNALFWLRNHTKGREERPFTVNENGQVRFW